MTIDRTEQADLIGWLRAQLDETADDARRRYFTPYVLPLLALPYADRPGYRESWRPS